MYFLKEKGKTKLNPLTFEIWRAKKPPSFCWDRGSYLSCRTASTVAVSSWIGVKRSRVLLGCLHHPFCYREIWGADVGSRQGPLIPGRLRAALSDHVTGLWPVVRLISVIKLLLKTSRALLEGITGNLEKRRSAAILYKIKYVRAICKFFSHHEISFIFSKKINSRTVFKNFNMGK